MTTSVGDEVFCPLFSQRSNARKCLRILNGLLNNGQFVDPPTQYVDLFEPLVTLFLLQRPSRGRGKSNDDAGKSDDDARISSPSPSHPRSRKNISLPNGNGLPVSVPVTPKEIYEAGEALLSDPDAVLAFEQSMAGIFVAVFPSMFHPFLSTKLRKKPETPASSTSLKLKKEVSPKPKADRKRSRSTSLPPSVSSEAIESVNASKPSECSSLLDSLRISIEEAGDSFCEPFAKDSEFIKAIEAFYYLRDRYLGVLALSDILKYLVRKAGIEPFEMFTLHRNILSLLQHHTHIRTLSMEREPKVLQLSKKLNLSSKETKALVYLVMAQGGSVCCVDLPQAFHPASIAYRCGMDVEELHHFLQEDREHIHQGLLVVSESTFLPSSKVLLPQEAAVALSGVSVSHEQMAKLENTVLGELIVSEWQKRDEDSNADAEAEEPHSESADEEPGEEETNESLIVGDSTSCEAVEDAKKNIPIVSPSGSAGGVAAELAVTKSNEPYRSNCECMEAAFYLISLMIKIRTMEGDIKEEQELEKRKKEEAAVRGLEGKLRIAQKVHTSRVKVTIEAGAFIPAIEVLSKKFGLTEMEKNILLLLVGNAISHDVVVAINGRYFMREGQRYMTVGYVLFVLCKGLTQRVEARQAFYHSSRLVSNSLISLSVEMGVSRSCFNTDLMEYTCDIDRKIVDLLMGREMESREMVPGSSVISPTVSLDKVVLPRAVMEKVLSRVEHFSLVNECKKKFAFGENLGESMNGLVLLFYGPSGTGKTMLAHAVAKEIGKKLLLVDTANFKRAANGPEILRYLFREAKLRDAIIFFDECESIFASREDNALVTTLLAEFEKYDGMILLATNVAECFDESMNRRISLMIEFKPPDHSMRHQIWASHIPPKLSLAPDVSLEQLALDYELTGGLIRNAVLAAINNAVSRENTSSPTLQMEDFETGAKHQLRGFFMAAKSPTGQSHYITPKRRLEELIVNKETKRKIDQVAKLCKSRSTLFSLWGFSEDRAADQGTIYLFHGPSGTGKSLAAEGIAYESGLTMRVCNARTLAVMEGAVSHVNSIGTVFEEAQKLGAMVVIKEAQCLFHQSSSSDGIQIVMYHALRHPKPVILIGTTKPPSTIDFTQFPFPITLSIPFNLPQKEERSELWKQAFPTGVPLETSLDFDVLSDYSLSPKQIGQIAFQVCCKAALLPAQSRKVTMEMIVEQVQAEVHRDQARRTGMSVYI